MFDAEPGDTIDIEIQPRGIDEEFVIAAIEYRWGVDETILTIVEKRGDVDDILSELNESVQRVEMDGANRDAPKNRITTTDAGAIIDVSVDADGTTPSDTRFVNDGRRAVRDTWTGDDPPDISTLVVGDDGSGLSRSNSELRNQTNSAAVSQSLPDSKSVVFEATITQTGVRELGLETADGRLITRVVFDDAIDIDGPVSVTLDVSNDGSVSRGVLTNDGQTAVRDVLADNTPTLPNAYGYGDDGTAVAESDTALGNELVSVSLDEILIQSASTTAQWDLIAPTDDEILLSKNDELRQAQTAVFIEAEDADSRSSYNIISDADFSGGSGLEAATTATDTAEWAFEWPDYTLPASRVGIAVRLEQEDREDPPDGTVVTLNNTDVDEISSTLSPLGWFDLPTFGPATTYAQEGGPDLEAGATQTLEITSQGDDVGLKIDAFAIYDTENTDDVSSWDNSTDSNQALADPKLFPDVTEVPLETATTRRNIDEANFVSTWNDTSNAQFVELANDGSTFTRINNADQGSVTFASLNTGVDTNIGISRFASNPMTTPSEGDTTQVIQDWQLFANPDAVFTDDIGSALTRAIIPPDTLAPETTIREAGLKSDSVLLTRHELAEFSVLEGQRISSSETSSFTGSN